eukprot:TRINITY_DN4133_c0_g1_i4.p1 TRINITY_DN4133_c0_g1~~TRINITY_DN4133_c0_g1_i4.p1  ORF type:complete len:307 (+),score=55.75 TRINITY_DN4133_c0_g1_i4:50-970(+)
MSQELAKIPRRAFDWVSARPWIHWSLLGLGALSVASRTFRFLRWFRVMFLMRKLNLINRYGANSWAVVTGASDGMGREFAVQLAQEGFNIVLHGRDQAKTAAVEQLVKQANPKVQTRIVLADFKRGTTADFYDDFYNQIKDLDVSILVNNAGVRIEDLHKVEDQYCIDGIITNCVPYVLLTKKLLPQMNRRGKRCAIISVSSALADLRLPFAQTYIATKIFNQGFSDILAKTVDSNKIDVLCCKPGLTDTNFHGDIHVDPKRMVSSREAVQGFLAHLGRMRETYGSRRHGVPTTIQLSIPSFIMNR